MSAHLASAARELERLLGGIYPQQTFVVEVEAGDGGEAGGLRASLPNGRKPRTQLQDLNTRRDRRAHTAANRKHDDRLKQGA